MILRVGGVFFHQSIHASMIHSIQCIRRRGRSTYPKRKRTQLKSQYAES